MGKSFVFLGHCGVFWLDWVSATIPHLSRSIATCIAQLPISLLGFLTSIAKSPQDPFTLKMIYTHP